MCFNTTRWTREKLRKSPYIMEEIIYKHDILLVIRVKYCSNVV